MMRKCRKARTLHLCLRSPTGDHLVGTGLCSCVPGLLAILFKRKYKWACNLIQQRRERLHYRGVMKQFKHERIQHDGNEYGVDWSELVAILRRAQPTVRTRTLTKEQTVAEFARRVKHRTDVSYVIGTINHVMLIKNGLITDCFAERSHPYYSSWRSSTVMEYCVLKNQLSRSC